MFRSRLPRFAALVALSAALLAGCTPSGTSQLDEERESHYLAGINREKTLDFQGAIECFEKALEVNPRSASAHLELGWIYEQRETDPAAAIYHYQRYITFRPSAGNVDTIKLRITNCKQELARTVSLGPISQGMQRDFEKMADENKKLQEENQKLKQALATASAAPVTPTAPPPAPVARSTPPPPTPASTPSRAPAPSSTTNRPQTLAASVSSASTRSYTIKSGDTPSSVARKYNLRLETLMAANPGLDARKLRVGQTLNLPAQ